MYVTMKYIYIYLLLIVQSNSEVYVYYGKAIVYFSITNDTYVMREIANITGSDADEKSSMFKL